MTWSWSRKVWFEELFAIRVSVIIKQKSSIISYTDRHNMKTLYKLFLIHWERKKKNDSLVSWYNYESNTIMTIGNYLYNLYEKS